MGTEPRSESEGGIRVVEETENTDKTGGQREKHHSAQTTLSRDPEANYFTGRSHWLKVPDQFFPHLGFLPLEMPAAESGIGLAIIV